MGAEQQRANAWVNSLVAGKPWIAASDVLQGAARQGRDLLKRGASRVFCMAGRKGTGELPEPSGQLALVDLGLPVLGMIESIRATQEAMRCLPAPVLTQLRAFDPHSEMRVIGPFFFRGDPVDGRTTFGRRPDSWQDLEDKTVIDAVWDAAGLARAPSAVVPISEISTAFAELDEGHGVVVALDNKHGFHGGGVGTRWARTADSLPAILSWAEGQADVARVMPFLEGVPCSVHGLVFPDYVAAFRPCEMMVLRHAAPADTFRYMRAATLWDPSLERREEMRSAVKRIGAYLGEELGYAGAFTIDGVMTAEGFRPTELNPRVGAAMSLMLTGFPCSLFHFGLVEGLEYPGDPEALEAELLEQADAQRQLSMGITTEVALEGLVKRPLSWRNGDWVETTEDEADAWLIAGPGPSGGFVNLRAEEGFGSIGPSAAPYASAMIRYADAAFGLGIGAVEMPCDYR